MYGGLIGSYAGMMLSEKASDEVSYMNLGKELLERISMCLWA